MCRYICIVCEVFIYLKLIKNYHLFQLGIVDSEQIVSHAENSTEYIDESIFDSRVGLKSWTFPYEYAHDFTSNATNIFRGKNSSTA